MANRESEVEGGRIVGNGVYEGKRSQKKRYKRKPNDTYERSFMCIVTYQIAADILAGLFLFLKRLGDDKERESR